MHFTPILFSFIIGCILSTELTAVQILTNSNFTSFIAQNDISLVMFYAPWCGHSKTFLPTFDQVAEELKGENFHVAKVDCVEEEKIYWSNKIEGFPTLKVFFGNGRSMDPIQYKGERELELVVDFVRRLGGSSFSQDDLTVLNFEDYKSRNLTPLKPIVVAYQSSDDSTKIQETVDYICKKLENVQCSVTSDPALARTLGIHSDGSGVAMLRSFFKEAAIVVAPRNVVTSGPELFSWVQKLSYPLLVEFHPGNDPVLFSDKRPGFQIHVVTVVDTTNPSSEQILDDLVAASSEFAGRCVFVYIDVGDGGSHVTRILDDLQLNGESGPTAMIIRSMKTQVQFYKLDEGTDVNADSVKYWVEQFFGNQLVPVRTVSLQE